MGLVDKTVFEDRGARGCSDSDYDFAITTCCERVGVVDEELCEFYWSSDTPSRSITLLPGTDCPFCGASNWSYRKIDDLNHVPEHWRWACDGRTRPGRRIVRPLADHVAELLEFCRRTAHPVPEFDAILFLNTADPRVRYDAGWIAESGALQSVADLTPAFDRLLVAGYSWLNLSAYGLFRGNLVIGLELPPEQTGCPTRADLRELLGARARARRHPELGIQPDADELIGAQRRRRPFVGGPARRASNQLAAQDHPGASEPQRRIGLVPGKPTRVSTGAASGRSAGSSGTGDSGTSTTGAVARPARPAYNEGAMLSASPSRQRR